ncbi:hypothetical protein K7X08_014335 [Anisodus acutangulus]|uniref:Uncharacterized protein n=1 Tax=Anisodus acutangulus TaxID=402998 RepID=A0A9Q1LK07_9SOLA|nr:hypothetical protein K7X08_014335 [Anisodus acutangulus]
MGEEQHHNRGLEINPVLVGLLGVIAGAIIVVILHFVIVTWCKNSTSPDPPDQNTTTIPVSQSQNRSRANAQHEISSSTSNSMVQLIVLSSCPVCRASVPLKRPKRPAVNFDDDFRQGMEVFLETFVVRDSMYN